MGPAREPDSGAVEEEEEDGVKSAEAAEELVVEAAGSKGSEEEEGSRRPYGGDSDWGGKALGFGSSNLWFFATFLRGP